MSQETEKKKTGRKAAAEKETAETKETTGTAETSETENKVPETSGSTEAATPTTEDASRVADTDAKGDAEKPAKDDKKAAGKTKRLILIGAGSFSGRGVRNVKKGEPIEVDLETAKNLLATGMFKEGA